MASATATATTETVRKRSRGNDVSEKRQTLQAMHNFLLINLDEFNQISPKLQEGFLKNVIQQPCVKIKRPYGKLVEKFREGFFS